MFHQVYQLFQGLGQDWLLGPVQGGHQNSGPEHMVHVKILIPSTLLMLQFWTCTLSTWNIFFAFNWHFILKMQNTWKVHCAAKDEKPPKPSNIWKRLEAKCGWRTECDKRFTVWPENLPGGQLPINSSPGQIGSRVNNWWIQARLTKCGGLSHKFKSRIQHWSLSAHIYCRGPVKGYGRGCEVVRLLFLQ